MWIDWLFGGKEPKEEDEDLDFPTSYVKVSREEYRRLLDNQKRPRKKREKKTGENISANPQAEKEIEDVQ